MTDKEKGLIENEFDSATHVAANKWILSDISIVACRLKEEGRILSDVPSFETMKAILEKVEQAEQEEKKKYEKEEQAKKPIPSVKVPRKVKVYVPTAHTEVKPKTTRRPGLTGYLKGFLRHKMRIILRFLGHLSH